MDASNIVNSELADYSNQIFMALPKDLPQLLKENEDVTNTLKDQIEFYKSEHLSLRTEITHLMDENHQLYEQLKNQQKPCAASLSSPRHRKGNDMVTNLQRQLSLTVQEKDSAIDMWQLALKEVDSLEDELKAYQSNRHVELACKQLVEVQEEYSTAILLLEEKLASVSAEAEQERLAHEDVKMKLRIVREDLRTALQNIQHRDIERQEGLETTNSAIMKIKEFEELVKLQSADLKEACSSRQEMEHLLEKSQLQVELLKSRDCEAHNKVEEALLLVEEAVCQREALVSLEAISREENVRLQAALSDVVEEAGIRVKSEVDKVKNEFNKLIEIMNKDMKNMERINTEKTVILERIERERQQLAVELELAKREMDKPEGPSIMEHKINVAYRELTEYERRNYLASLEAENLRQEIVRLQENQERTVERKDSERKDERKDERLHLSNVCAELEAVRNRASDLQEHVYNLEREVQRLQKTPSQQCGTNCQAIANERIELLSCLQEIQRKGAETSLELQHHLECQQALKVKWQNTVKSITDSFEMKIRELRLKLQELKREKRELQEELNRAKKDLNKLSNTIITGT